MKYLLAAVSAVLLSSAASAADLPARVVKPGIAPAAAGCFWKGPYVGVQAGYTWGTFNSNLSIVGQGPGTGPVPDTKHSKITGGVYGGYNFCVTPSLIVGFEADVMKYGHSGKFNSIVGGTGYGVENDANWGGSLRLRVGLPFDRFMVYATGGLAGAQLSGSQWTRVGGVNILNGSGSKFATGLVVGAGLEYAFTQNLVGRIEYNYTSFGNVNTGGGANFKSNFNTIRLGVAYKF